MATKRTPRPAPFTLTYDADNVTVVLKNSTVRGKVPAPSDLEVGELALSLYKGEESIWAKNSEGCIVKLNSISKDNLWEKDFGVFIGYDSYDAFVQDLEAGAIDNKSIVFVSDESNRGIWTQGTFYNSFDPSKYYTKDEIDDTFLTKEEADEKYITTADIATHDKSGLMSAEDKARLDNIYDGDLDVAVPEIKGEWNIYDNEQTFIESSSASKLILEEGYKVRWEGTYSWTHAEGYKDPVSIGSGSAWDVLTESGVESPAYDSGLIDVNTEISIGLEAPRTGLMVNDKNTIISADGYNDSSATVVSVKFMHRCYYGNLTTNMPIASDILSLDSQLIDTRNILIPLVDCDETEYYYYAYPKVLGDLKTIQQNEANVVLGAFEKKEVSVVNEAGLEIILNVYITNNPGAFTNSSLEFK